MFRDITAALQPYVDDDGLAVPHGVSCCHGVQEGY